MQIVRWIWAAPCVFLVHDAEEIATVAPWLRNNRADLPTAIQPFATVTTEQFTLGVGLLFLILLACTLHAVRRARAGHRSLPFLLVVGALVANGITHLFQAAAFRGYRPGLVTAVILVIPYGIGLGEQLRTDGLMSRGLWLGMIALGALLQVPIVIGTLAAVR
jgi:uncharacterized protein with HXXEE motif